MLDGVFIKLNTIFRSKKTRTLGKVAAVGGGAYGSYKLGIGKVAVRMNVCFIINVLLSSENKSDIQLKKNP